MKYILILLALFSFNGFGLAQKIKITEPVHFLALGDSYTIGQSVGINDRWPSQFADRLTKKDFNVKEVMIIAQTGWRTDDLNNAINQQQPLTGYNLVSLLIGVNNQYQGGSIQKYATEFEDLLKTAINLSGNIPQHVFVISIPDYAYTPFGKGNINISNQIDQFNAVNRDITNNYNVKYINITPISRNGLEQPDLVASDGLHPSGKMYELWVDEIMKSVEKELGINDEIKSENAFSYTLMQKQLIIKSKEKLTELHLYNAAGKTVRAERLTSSYENTINLEGLPSGMYFLLLRNNSNAVFKSKIVVH